MVVWVRKNVLRYKKNALKTSKNALKSIKPAKNAKNVCG